MNNYDVIIIGGGASGFAAAQSLRARGRKFLIIDMGEKTLRKVLISGGGRCNFTNLDANSKRYFGNNPEFVHSALARISPNDILYYVQNHKIKTFQKHTGQFFVDGSSTEIVNAIQSNIKSIKINTTVKNIEKNGNLFKIYTDHGDFFSNSVIIASGGISYPQIGVSDIGYKVAKHFGHKIVMPRPALCGIKTNTIPHDLAGISMPVKIKIDLETLYDDLLFTHFGVGGPAIYRATVRNVEHGLEISLLPDIDIAQWIKDNKYQSGQKNIIKLLSEKIPFRVAQWIVQNNKRIADMTTNDINDIANRLVVKLKDFKLHIYNSV